MISCTGTVKNLTFHSKENGFTVARIEKDNTFVTVTGVMPGITEGEKIHVKGTETNHPKYGYQIKVWSWERLKPSGKEELKNFLISGAIKGIGPSLAEKIIKRFGNSTEKILDESPDRLLDIPGVGKKNLNLIIKTWNNQKNARRETMFFQKHQIPPVLTAKIMKRYGENAFTVIRQDPYKLVSDIEGIGFKKADHIAILAGIPPDSPKRIKAAILFSIFEATSKSGHLFLYREDLKNKTLKLLDLSDELNHDMIISEAIDLLIAENKIIEEMTEGVNSEKKKAYYPAYLYYFEKLIAENLIKRVKVRALDTEPEIVFKTVTEKENITLSEKQKEAVILSITSGIIVITGGPGTGKTTVLKAIFNAAALLKKSVVAAAPTGRAAKRLEQAINTEASTIHRLLEYNPIDRKFRRNAENPLKADMVIIDEASMIDTELFYYLLCATPEDASVIIVGDVHQLPSIGPGQVLNDIIKSETLPVIKLNQIFRQASQSQIVQSAWQILKGITPTPTPPGQSDFYFIKSKDLDDAVNTLKILTAYRIPKILKIDPINDIQVLAPMYGGPLGTDNLNEELSKLLNPQKSKPVQYGKYNFYNHDKIMQVKNNYDTGIFNGDTGRIIYTNPAEKQIHAAFGTKTIEYKNEQISQMIPAYAVTIHKSQGSEYPAVIILLSMRHYPMLKKDLLYTGVTRGKQLVVIIGSSKAVNTAVKSDENKKRNTNLKNRLVNLKA